MAKNYTRGHIGFKKNTRANKATGEELNERFGTDTYDPNTIYTPYKLGSKTVYMTEAKAQVMRQQIDAHNRALKSKPNKADVLKAKASLIGKAVSKDELQRKARQYMSERIHREANRLRSKAEKTDYQKGLETYLARMPHIVFGMRRFMRGDPELDSLVDEFFSKFNRMSEEDRKQFFEENAQLFRDISDYYNHLKGTAGNMPGTKPKIEGALEYEDNQHYRDAMVDLINDTNMKLDEFIERKAQQPFAYDIAKSTEYHDFIEREYREGDADRFREYNTVRKDVDAEAKWKEYAKKTVKKRK